MTPGITAALMSQPDAPFAVLEVDEMHLAEVCKMVRPEVIVLLNLSRDQLDRVGEIATIEKRVRQAVIENPKTKLVVNIDDPLMTSAALSSDRAIWPGKVGRKTPSRPHVREAPLSMATIAAMSRPSPRAETRWCSGTRYRSLPCFPARKRPRNIQDRDFPVPYRSGPGRELTSR